MYPTPYHAVTYIPVAVSRRITPSRTYMYAYMHAYLYAYTRTCMYPMHACMRTCTMYMYMVHVHGACTTYVCTRVRVHVRVYVYMYAYMYAYMYVRDGVIRRDMATGMYVTA